MILLSFDIEEFDLPLEYHVDLSLESQIKYSQEGISIILDLLKKYQIKATFFCTALFAINSRELIFKIIQQGHEVASHGYAHSSFTEVDLKKSKDLLEEITGKQVKGFRKALMMKTDLQTIANAGYTYDSSLNPTFIPGRYNNLHLTRTYYQENGIMELPASVSPIARIPLFWLSLHNFPFSFYSYLCRRTLKKDGYLNLYFHSWEFSSQLNDKGLQVPSFIRRNSGDKLQLRLERLIQSFLFKGETFQRISDFLDDNKSKFGVK